MKISVGIKTAIKKCCIKYLQGSDTTRNRKLNSRLTSKSEVKLMRNVSRYKNGDT